MKLVYEHILPTDTTWLNSFITTPRTASLRSNVGRGTRSFRCSAPRRHRPPQRAGKPTPRAWCRRSPSPDTSRRTGTNSPDPDSPVCTLEVGRPRVSQKDYLRHSKSDQSRHSFKEGILLDLQRNCSCQHIESWSTSFHIDP